MRMRWCGLLVVFFSASLMAADAPFALSADEQAIVDQTNMLRQRAGKALLKINALLFIAARKHAANMAAEKKLEHRLNGKSSSDRVTATGYKWTTVSENIAWNQLSVAEVMQGWMRSEGHRMNLLGSDITEMGAAVAANAQGELYWVQVFARPEVEEQYVPRALKVEPGAVSRTIHFAIHNVAKMALTVNVHAEKLFTINPGETVTYNLTTASANPPVEVKHGITMLEFTAHEGEKYTINKRGNEMDMTQSSAETR